MIPHVLLFLVTASAFAQVSPYKQIDFNWNYTPNLPVCTTQLAACHLGFTIKDITSGHVLVGPNVLTRSVRSWAYFPGGGVQYGTHVFELVANAYTASGQPVDSTPARVTIVVGAPPSSPTAFKGAVQ